jgi:mono/diheme cytochrome c family protein
MWKKIALIVVLIVIAVPAGGLGYLYFRKPAQAPPRDVKVAMTPERIERGRYLFQNVADCDGCHSQRDFSRIDGPIVPAGRGRGSVLSSLFTNLPGTVVASNITPDPETGIGTWTDGEKIRAIRDGVDKYGRALFPMMPYAGFRTMSDDDVEALVAYLNSLTPIRNRLPATQLSFPVNLMIKGVPQPVGSVPPPDRADRAQYGKYLTTIAGCEDCHTPTEKGQPIPGMAFAGGQEFPSTIGRVLTANITPHPDTGIGKWDEAFFLKKFADYKEYAANGTPRMTGPEQFTLMPWLDFSGMQPEDLRAIYAYLRTVKPVDRHIEIHPEAAK